MRLRVLRSIRDGSMNEEETKRLVPVRRGPTILLVEDDFELRELLALVLRNDGYTVIEAEDGDDALEWLGLGALEGEPQRRPALIVTDVCLPFLSGLDLLEGLSAVTRSLPIVLITGARDPATHQKALALGALCVLEKPFQMSDFRSVVRSAIRQHEHASNATDDFHVA
jgi:DNA-binding response OmpR family regulator